MREYSLCGTILLNWLSHKSQGEKGKLFTSKECGWQLIFIDDKVLGVPCQHSVIESNFII